VKPLDDRGGTYEALAEFVPRTEREQQLDRIETWVKELLYQQEKESRHAAE
jgi:hypothetical protein